MKKSFCDHCGDEIKVDSEWILGKELCPVCSGIISDWLNNKTPILDVAAAAEDYKPTITDPECCGKCRNCEHVYQGRDEVTLEVIIGCLHYHKRLRYPLDEARKNHPLRISDWKMAARNIIQCETITPETFKTKGEEIYPDCHGYNAEELE